MKAEDAAARVGYAARRIAMRKRSSNGPEQPQPSTRPPLTIYSLHMRNAADQGRNTWGIYVKAGREGMGITGAEFARRARVDRATLYRWETGKSQPEDMAAIRRVAEVLEVDLSEALAAAGFHPATDTPPPKPTREPDPEIDMIRASKLSRVQKEALVRHVRARREREQQTRLAELEMIVRAQERER